MAEWSNAAASKAVVRASRTGGPNPPLSATPLKLQDRRYFFWIIEYDSLGDRYDVGSGGAVPQFSYFVESETRLFETGRFGNSPESVIAISES